MLLQKTNEEAGIFSALPMPYGVNLGSWLSLEDYFYVGSAGAREVASSRGMTQGNCLPPLHTGQAQLPKWNSETDLYANLVGLNKTTDGNDDSSSSTVRDALRIFHAFRVAYLDFKQELSQISAAGIKAVRVPLSW